MENNEHLSHMRHTLAHLLAQAVVSQYPNALLTLGPSVDNGFYYDIDFGTEKINDEEFKIFRKDHEEKSKFMERIYSQRSISQSEAKEYFKGNVYKLEIIDEIVSRGEKITLYTCGNFTDLCRGGHVENPAKEIKI
jgi:threonyl-tRNA synthetase